MNLFLISKKLFPLLSLIVLISFLFLANFAWADEPPTTIDNPLLSETFEDLLTAITNAIGLIIGSVAVVMLIIAGFYFLTSSGDPEKIQKAKNFLKYAIIGIVTALVAGPIVELIKWILGVKPPPS